MRISDWSSDVCSSDLQDALGGNFGPVGKAYLLRAGDGGTRLEHGDLVVVERLAIEALEPIDLGEHIVAQHGPVELAVGHVPAEFARVVDILGEMRAVNEQFLGHAAANDAGRSEENTSELPSLMRTSYT